MIMASRQINIFIDCEVYNLSAHYNLSQVEHFEDRKQYFMASEECNLLSQ